MHAAPCAVRLVSELPLRPNETSLFRTSQFQGDCFAHGLSGTGNDTNEAVLETSVSEITSIESNQWKPGVFTSFPSGRYGEKYSESIMT